MKRVNYQVLLWNLDCIPQPVIPSPFGHGWTEENGKITPVLCEMSCAPPAILKFIRCSCLKNRCNPPCKCHSNSLPCTEMCECGGKEEECDNCIVSLDIQCDNDSSDDENSTDGI